MSSSESTAPLTLACTDWVSASAFEALQALDEILRKEPGHKIFTVLWIDWELSQHRRIYSSVPNDYPCGGAKPLQLNNEFFRTNIAEGVGRICRNRDECRAAFSDYAIFEKLGCHSAVNVPIRRNGRTHGSINLLHQENWYIPEMLSGLSFHAEKLALQLCSSIPDMAPIQRKYP